MANLADLSLGTVRPFTNTPDCRTASVEPRPDRVAAIVTGVTMDREEIEDEGAEKDGRMGKLAVERAVVARDELTQQEFRLPPRPHTGWRL